MAPSALRLHEKAIAVRPQDVILTKPKTMVVAVLKAGKDPESRSLGDSDFLWLKCNPHIQISVTKKNYFDRFGTPGEDLSDVYLTSSGIRQDDRKTVDGLNVHGDNFVSLEVVATKIPDGSSRQSKTPTTPSRKPLAPKATPYSWNTLPNSPTPALKPCPPSHSVTDEKQSPCGPISNNDGQHELVPGQPVKKTLLAEDVRVESYDQLREFASLFIRIHSIIHVAGCSLDPQEVIENEARKWARNSAELRQDCQHKASLFLPPSSAGNGDFKKILEDFIPLNAGFFRFFLSYAGEQWRESMKRPYDDEIRIFEDMAREWVKSPTINRLLWINAALMNYPTRIHLNCLSGASGSFPNSSAVRSVGPISDGFTRAGFPTSDNSRQQIIQLQNMFANSPPELLEAAVEKGKQVLEKMVKYFSGPGFESCEDAQHWLEATENLKKKAVQSKAIIGVVGNTGSGKSSVINAILDEEALLSTNCYRACTAVVTEVSYNHDGVPYRGEVEFITADEWQRELKILFDEATDGNGQVSRDATNEETEAGVSYAKIKAVYPKMTKDQIATSSVEKLMRHDNVRNVLGQKRIVTADDSLFFSRKLKKYVDSKDKNEKKDKQSNSHEMEFWPLVKIVRIYTKADALSTGAVIVDLPGVHDSNVARSAVAAQYMRKCTGRWIVAPIYRAVDDKAAKSLLGDTFKRQVKMDGGINTVTFICSKTDDINLSEAQTGLGLDEQMEALWEKSDQNTQEINRLEEEMTNLKDTRGLYSETFEDADEQLDVWEKLHEDEQDGKTVYAPKGDRHKSPLGKRKPTSSKQSKRTKRQRVDSENEDGSYQESSDDESEHDEVASDAESDSEDKGEPLTASEIDDKIVELRQIKKDARQKRSAVDGQIKVVRNKLKEVKDAEEVVQTDLSAIAIEGRNRCSMKAIQDDFASGIRELDQETAEEEDSANFNPEEDARNYEEVARSLPVFCVSSKAYQKLSGRFRKEKKVPGFTTVEATEIPQLQAHCKSLTVKGRINHGRAFLNALSQHLNSLRLWSSDDGSGVQLTEAQKGQESEALDRKLKELDNAFEETVMGISKSLQNELAENVYGKFGKMQGGYHWSSYKAICRRNGVFQNYRGLNDWNAELVEPIIKDVTPGWERTFSRRAPHLYRPFAEDCLNELKKFHSWVEQRSSQNGGRSLASLQMLKQHQGTYHEVFKDLSTATVHEVIENAKKINREFQPVIMNAVSPAYGLCTAESGGGSFQRMKNHMQSRIAAQSHYMFRASTDKVKSLLKDMIKDVESTMLAKMDECFLGLKRDYLSSVLGAATNGELLPREQRHLRKQVLHVIERYETSFQRILAQEPDDEVDEDDDDPERMSLHEDDLAYEFEDGGDETGAAGVTGGPVKEEESNDGFHDALHDVKAEPDSTDSNQAPIKAEDNGIPTDSKAPATVATRSAAPPEGSNYGSPRNGDMDYQNPEHMTLDGGEESSYVDDSDEVEDGCDSESE